MGMPPGFNKSGLHNLKRKKRRKGLRTFSQQKHPQKQVSPALSMLGFQAAKAAKSSKGKGI